MPIMVKNWAVQSAKRVRFQDSGSPWERAGDSRRRMAGRQAGPPEQTSQGQIRRR